MEDMPKIPNTVIRGNTYYLRVRIPQDLIKIYNKKEKTKSLKTSDPRSARTLAAQEYAKILREFEQKRLEQSPPVPNDKDMLSKFSDAQLIIPVFEWLKTREELNNDAYLSSNIEAFGEEFDLMLIDMEAEKGFYEDSLKGEMKENYGATLANKELKKQNITFDKKTKAFKKVSTLFSEALIESTAKQIHRLKRNAVPEYINPRFKDIPTQPSYNQITFGALIEEFIKNKEKNWSERTKKSNIAAMGVFKEIVSEATYITEIDRKKCRELREALLILPNRLRNSYPKSKYSFKEACKKARRDGKRPISTSTANDYISTFSGIMRYAFKEQYIASSPAEDLQEVDDRPNKDKRYPFTKEQLQQIFIAPLYTGCKDNVYGQNIPGDLIPRTSGRFWAPVMSLWTGMRMGECLQLERGDIGQENGIDVIYIRKTDEAQEGEGNSAFEKRVKNKFSIRYIPIHPELKKIGFLQFVSSLSKEKNTRLFPEVKPYEGSLVHAYSKWFGGTFLENNIDGKIPYKTVFHSFRHNYKDAMKRAEVPYEIQGALGGWSTKLGVQEDYGGEHDPEQLLRHLQKITYPDLDLSHLYTDTKDS